MGRRQQGMIVFWAVIALAIVAFTIVLGYSTWMTKQEAELLPGRQRAYLEDLQRKLQDFYLKHAEEIDATSTGGPYRDPDNVMQLAGIQPKWGLQLAVSDRQYRAGVAYTVYAAWLPLGEEMDAGPVFSPASGSLTLCPGSASPPGCERRLYVIVDGYPVQMDAYTRTIRTLEGVAARLQAYFKSKFLLDPDRRVNRNHFRPASATCDRVPDELPCVDVYTALTNPETAPVVSLAGLSSDLLGNAWGGPVEVSNLQDASTSVPPFSMVVRTRAPWGDTYTVQAVQDF